MSLEKRVVKGLLSVPLAQRVRDINQGSGSHTLLQRWKILDRHFLKPLFGGRHFSAAAVRGHPLVAPDGELEEDDEDDEDTETPRQGASPRSAPCCALH